jgi:hypothetical protein
LTVQKKREKERKRVKKSEKDCTVKPVLTATSAQRPPVNNGQFEALTTSLKLTYH